MRSKGTLDGGLILNKAGEGRMNQLGHDECVIQAG